MNNLQYWESQKLIKELEFVESDFFYLSELIYIGNIEFLKSVDLFLDSFPDIKEIYKNKQNKEIINGVIITNDDVIEIENIESIKKDVNPELKRLYRQIAKNTHPDKVSDLEDVYKEANKAYEADDLPTILKICLDLKIDFEWTPNFIEEVSFKINNYKEKRIFLESNFIYKWLKAKDDEKSVIIVEFLKNKIL